MFVRDIGIAAAIGVGCFVVVALRVPDWYVFPVAILAIGLAVAARAVEAGAVTGASTDVRPAVPREDNTV